jgi:hypothetical protein
MMADDGCDSSPLGKSVLLASQLWLDYGLTGSL